MFRRSINTLLVVVFFALTTSFISFSNEIAALNFGNNFFEQKAANVEASPKVKVIPGGHSIGVVVKAQGISVVGFAPVTVAGEKKYPGKDAGLQLGDLILKINNQSVAGDEETARIINENGARPMELLIKRTNRTFTLKLNPVLDKEAGCYRIGIYIRDSAAGVGTLTFFNPQNHGFGALGHAISDKHWQEVLEKGQGKIIEAFVQGISEAGRGDPGEKIGLFIEKNAEISGEIVKTSQYGIFGTIDQNLTNELYPEPVEVASFNEVRQGEAEILTVIEGNKIERFSVNIERIFPGRRPDGRSLILKITDKSLLEKTGGIIQGMSGSPIIQDGKLVGAVTHVFINDPTRGYGVLAETMLKEVNWGQTKKLSVNITNAKKAA